MERELSCNNVQCKSCHTKLRFVVQQTILNTLWSEAADTRSLSWRHTLSRSKGLNNSAHHSGLCFLIHCECNFLLCMLFQIYLHEIHTYRHFGRVVLITGIVKWIYRNYFLISTPFSGYRFLKRKLNKELRSGKKLNVNGSVSCFRFPTNKYVLPLYIYIYIYNLIFIHK